MESEILTCLKIISMIREGQKLSVRNGVLHLEMYSSGLWSALKRRFFNDSRHITMTYVQNIILNALDKEVRVKYLNESLNGLNALKVTYSDDVTVVARLTVLEEKIQEYIIHKDGSASSKIQRSDNSGKRTVNT